MNTNDSVIILPKIYFFWEERWKNLSKTCPFFLQEGASILLEITWRLCVYLWAFSLFCPRDSFQQPPTGIKITGTSYVWEKKEKLQHNTGNNMLKTVHPNPNPILVTFRKRGALFDKFVLMHNSWNSCRCGGELQYLDDKYCVKRFPSATIDREWNCPGIFFLFKK